MDVQSRIVEITYDNSRNCTELHLFLNGYRNALREHIETVLATHSYLKFNLVLAVKPTPSLDKKLIETENYLLIYTRQILKKLDNAFEKLYERIQDKSISQPYEIFHVKCTIYKLFNSPFGGKIIIEIG